MVLHINSRLLNSLGLLSAGVLLANPGLVNAQVGQTNANLIAQAPKPTVPAVPAAPTVPAAPMIPAVPKVVDPMAKPMGIPMPETPKPAIEAQQPQTIVDVASANDSFKTLTAALKAAGLTEALSGDGPFTVFAPTDAAFAALPKGVVESLLKPENKALLVKILTYHVVPGKVLSTDLKAGQVESLEGSPIVVKLAEATPPKSTTTKLDPTKPAPAVTADPAKVGDAAKTMAAPKAAPMSHIMVNQAKVKIADVAASNGVIHAIDQVILPPDLMKQMSQNPAGRSSEAKSTLPSATTPKVTPKVMPKVMPKVPTQPATPKP
jgi:uncharacterized surface protein with fasciclin (FAS1) repeats